MLAALGRGCARHHWVVLGIWLVVAVAVSVSASAWGGHTVNKFSIPGSDSEGALDVMTTNFPQLAGTSAQVVFETKGETIEHHAAAIRQTMANLATIPGVASVNDPLDASTELLNSQTSANGTIAYGTVLFSKDSDDLPADTFDRVVAASANSEAAGLDVQFGGNLVDDQNPPTSTLSDYADLIGLAVALVLLLLVFRSVFIAVLPILNAIIGVTVAGGFMALIENSYTVPDVGPTLGTMLGLGIGVDYTLFVLTRASGELEAGHDPVDAMGIALSTAGRAVMFAGITICLGMIALLIVGIPLISQMGLVAAFYVIVLVLAAVTLVPALGGAVGPRLLSWRVGDPVPTIRPASSGPFAWLARTVTGHPILVATGALVVIAVLISPVRDLQTGWVGDGSDPADMTQRQAYDLLQHGFGPGVNGELIVVAKSKKGPITSDRFADAAATAKGIQAALAATPGVQKVSPPLPDTTQNPSAFVIEVQPETGPDDPATSDLVRTIRAQTIPAVVHDTSLAGAVHVGGLTATIIDLDTAISDALPLFMGVVLSGAFLLLLLVFRSVLIGAKAVLMNFLTIAATFGVLVAVFQWGWASSSIGMDAGVDIVSFVPLLVFAIVFGLSMDYEVFLMSSMQEHHLQTGDPRAAVSQSLATTGRVIMSAALVMFAVFAAFVSNPSPMVKQIGLGLAVGVFIDAAIVRLLLVPAIMRLLGRAGWWVPRWLDRIMPNVSIEGGAPPSPAPEAPVLLDAEMGRP
jgi:RND superfamily putative drug exporter